MQNDNFVTEKTGKGSVTRVMAFAEEQLDVAAPAITSREAISRIVEMVSVRKQSQADDDNEEAFDKQDVEAERPIGQQSMDGINTHQSFRSMGVSCLRGSNGSDNSAGCRRARY